MTRVAGLDKGRDRKKVCLEMEARLYVELTIAGERDGMGHFHVTDSSTWVDIGT